jgi:hypothetical protein
LKEHIFQALTAIVSNDGLGKKAFRPFVESFLDPAFRNFNHLSLNCGFAAQDFVLNLNKLYGNNVF